MQAFIENEARSLIKNIYNESTLQCISTRNITVPYPYPYGFIPRTLGEDGESLDCFIVTSQVLQTGKCFDVQLLGMLEHFENGVEDHKVLLSLKNDDVLLTDSIKSQIVVFYEELSRIVQDRKIHLGKFLSQKETLEYIHYCSYAA